MGKKTYITVANIIAAFAVVMLHANGSFWNFTADNKWIAENIIETFFYFAVPIFFMISGVTLLDYRKRITTKEFFIRRVNRTLIPFLVWSIFAVIYNKYTWGMNWNLAWLFDLIFNTKALTIYWFFIALYSVYLAIPVISLIPEHKRKKVFVYGIFLSLFIFSIEISCNLINIKYNKYFDNLALGGFMIYVVTGWLIDKYEIKKQNRYIIYAIGIVGFLIHLFGTQYLAFEHGKILRTFKGYLNVPAYMQSVAVFVLIRYTNWEKITPTVKNILEKLATATFGIYLIHYYFIIELKETYPSLFNSLDKEFLITILLFITCGIIVLIIKKIPILKRIF